MKLCIPTEDNSGLTGRVSAHFGSAPWFTLVDSESGAVRTEANQEHLHRPGHCDAAQSIFGLGVEAVVCSGLGRRAFHSMQRAGIEVYLTESPSVGEAQARTGFTCGLAWSGRSGEPADPLLA